METESQLQKVSQEQRLLDVVVSGCENCNIVSSAKILEINNKVFIEKECCEKRVFIDNDAKFFSSYYLPFKICDEKIKYGKSLEDLQQRFRKISIVLCLSVNARCNLDCPICYLKCENPQYPVDMEPSLDEISDIIKRNNAKVIAVAFMEPTLRKDLPEIISLISKRKKISLIVTNGAKLVDFDLVKKLKRAGLWHVCLSFDGLDDDTYGLLRGKSLLVQKLLVLKNLKRAKIITNLIAVIGKDINERQVLPMIHFAARNNDFIRKIFFDALSSPTELTEHTLSISDIYKQLSKELNLSIDYFIKWKKLRFNIYKLLTKIFGFENSYLFKSIIQDNVFFKVGSNNLEPLLSLKEIELMNDKIGKILNKSKLQIFGNLIYNFPRFAKLTKLFLQHALPIILHSRKLYWKLTKNVLEIEVANVRNLIDAMNINFEGSIFNSDGDVGIFTNMPL